MVLDVAATNLRAVRCYRGLGFQHMDQHYRPASHSSFRILRKEPRYQHLRQPVPPPGHPVPGAFLRHGPDSRGMVGSRPRARKVSPLVER